MFWNGVCRSIARLDGKLVIITGANAGIGRQTALDLARRGASLVLGCRDVTKGEAVAQEIRELNPGCSVTVIKLDLGSLKSVREFAQKTLDTAPKINVLINNAGVMMCPKGTTVDGFEIQFGTNHLGHFLLTNLLLERIKESAPARIVNVSSTAHYYAKKINFDDLNMLENYDARSSYSHSKLANILFTKELSERLEGTGVTTYSLHPGVVQTELFRHIGDTTNFIVDWGVKIFGKLFFKTPLQGAQTSIYCAVAEELEHESGKYYSDCQEKEPSSQAKDPEVARKLWKASCVMVGLEK